MQETDSTYERNLIRLPQRRSLLRRALPVATILVVLVLIAIIVPLINVNRFQRRIVSSLSESLGRPIHLDRISLTVLPLPGFTIENLVVGEDPAFGAEPFVRASEVRATLRISSLWRRRVEFTRIRLTDPSINLVKTPSGKWNLENILVQAARLEAAPTGQTRASGAPRFPYIEATGARLNLKLGDGTLQEKTPFSMTEADVALWLSSPQEWRLRLEGRPIRTDITVSDTGTVRMEGTLGRASSLNDVPVDLKAEWRNVPLGEASNILLGRDADLRGSMTVSASVLGTVARGAVQTTVHITDLRRADFVPLHALSFDLECQAGQSGAFRALTDLRCSWPPPVVPSFVALTGSIPDVSHLSSAAFELGSPGLPATTLLSWLHVAAAHVSPEMTTTGSLTGSLSHQPATTPASAYWSGQLTLANASMTIPSVADEPIVHSSMILRAVPPAAGESRGQFLLLPVPLLLGNHDFATLDGRFDSSGYALHLTGTALPSRLLALGAALPFLGDGLAEELPASATSTPVRFDLTATRPWNGPQSWHAANRAPAKPPRRR
jgi:hypothetical protein